MAVAVVVALIKKETRVPQSLILPAEPEQQELS
jgi:hypothetical protein